MSLLRSGWEGLRTVEKCAIAALLIAIGFELTSWVAFPFNGYDSFSHIFWIGEWHRMWQYSIFYPRWLPDSFHGFGAPSFYYYPPLTFVFSNLLYILSPDASSASIGKVLGILAFVSSGLSIWRYLHWRFIHTQTVGKGLLGTILGALLYMFAPYRMFNYSTRGALPEHLAFVCVPLVFWGMDLVIQRRKENDVRKGTAMFILALGFMVITNLPASAVTGIGLFVYVLTRKNESRNRGLALLLLGSVAVLLLTAFYLLPTVTMFGDVQLGRLWRPVPVVLSSPFLAIFTGQAITINSYTFLSLMGACTLWIAWMRKHTTNSPFFWMLTLIIIVQLPVVAKYLFVYVPPFTIVQISYRFSILLLIILAVVWQEELHIAPSNPDIKRAPIASIIVLFWSIGTIVLVGLQLANVHVHKHGPLPVGEAPEYATRWARPYFEWGDSLAMPFVNDSQTITWPENTRVSLLASVRKPYSDTIEYAAPFPSLALLRRSYWPSWKATVDGASVITTPDSLGRLTIAVPGGRHRLVVWLGTSSAAEVGSWISLSALLLLLCGWMVSVINQRKTPSDNTSRAITIF